MSPTPTRVLESYAVLFERLLGERASHALVDRKLRTAMPIGGVVDAEVLPWLRSLDLVGSRSQTASRHERVFGSGHAVVALEIRDARGQFLGALVVELPPAAWQRLGERPASTITSRLQPGLRILHRELSGIARQSQRIEASTERAQELEWLFGLTTRLASRDSDERGISSLLAAACQRIGADLAMTCIPERRVSVTRSTDAGAALLPAGSAMRDRALAWIQRHRRPLKVSAQPGTATPWPPCRMLAVPVVRRTGRVIGMLAFFRPHTAGPFAARHSFLARHLGHHVAALLEAQFDAATGLYTRAALEQRFTRGGDRRIAGTVLYIDIDRLHVINETWGFEIGDEVIVRIAELLGPPLVSQEALAARVSGDRFAVVLPELDTDVAATLAMALQREAARIRIGTQDRNAEISLSCGVAALIDVPQALSRALASAELACKTAKDRGRGRVEVYAVADFSMMRRHDDVVAVGRLRAALSADRMALHAQRIVSLGDPQRIVGYELLVRLRDEDGTLIMPGEFMSAAQRYQLLPSIDRSVVERALRQLAPFSAALGRLGITMSINVSGQSIGDAVFMQRFVAQLASSGVAPDRLVVEITEQSAVGNLTQAVELVRRLQQAGCQFALDDFGTGTNSLAYLKGFPVSRVKIDGSFVRDILTNERSEQTVHGIVQMARGMGIETVAEFVENEAISRHVRELGVDLAQGYAFGKPEPLEDVLRTLQERDPGREQRFEFDP